MITSIAVRGRRPMAGRVAAGRRGARLRGRSGITLTEILIAIMILGVGIVSLATLFPIGLLRLRDANRWSRSATLLQSAASDALARGLFTSKSFQYADMLNYRYGITGPSTQITGWYTTTNGEQYSPFTQDTPYYMGDWYSTSQNGTTYIGARAWPGGPGLPFAYDPLWRYQTISTTNGTQGYYIGDTYEARFGYGLTTVGMNGQSADYDGNGPPSAHGLPRITNFNLPSATVNNQVVPIMSSSIFVPNIFVSQEDVVWQEAKAAANSYTIGGVAGGATVTNPNPLLPDLNISGGTPSLDWRYSWMFTGQLSNASNLSTFDGNIVIFENRPFAIQTPANLPYTPAGSYSSQTYQVDGEIVVEGIFGYSGNIVQPGPNGNPVQGTPGYGTGADRTVLLRWPVSMPDPVVRPGDWIADVTYERQEQVANTRFYRNGAGGYPNAVNSLEWDNIPAQRCFWYQVQKVVPPATDPSLGAGYRSMVVYVNQKLQARTVLNGPGTPVYMNAALIAPHVINVIPQTIFIR